MRAVLVDVPQSVLDERTKLGIDRWDEVWEGELHMVPPPTSRHQILGARLTHAFMTLLGDSILVGHETGVRAAGAGVSDYRVPDVWIVKLERQEIVDDFIEGPPDLVIEVLSPGDESLQKLPFYARLGVPEIIVVDPKTRKLRLFRLAGTSYVEVSPDRDGRFSLDGLDLGFQRIEDEKGPALLVSRRNGDGAMRA